MDKGQCTPLYLMNKYDVFFISNNHEGTLALLGFSSRTKGMLHVKNAKQNNMKYAVESTITKDLLSILYKF